MLIGYARVSTGKQDLALQLDALERAGCERSFTDTASGALKSRPEGPAAVLASPVLKGRHTQHVPSSDAALR